MCQQGGLLNYNVFSMRNLEKIEWMESQNPAEFLEMIFVFETGIPIIKN
jgi:hypothetical protein